MCVCNNGNNKRRREKQIRPTNVFSFVFFVRSLQLHGKIRIGRILVGPQQLLFDNWRVSVGPVHPPPSPVWQKIFCYYSLVTFRPVEWHVCISRVKPPRSIDRVSSLFFSLSHTHTNVCVECCDYAKRVFTFCTIWTCHYYYCYYCCCCCCLFSYTLASLALWCTYTCISTVTTPFER